MKVLIFGGTGFVGRNLAKEFLSHGYGVYVVTRKLGATNKQEEVKFIAWENNSPLSAIKDVPEVDVVINLAGESIGNRRWSPAVKQEILQSRINTTRAIVTAINEGVLRPKVLINASAVGYYGPCQDEKITEIAEAGQDFLAEVCRAWEGEAYKVREELTRVVTIRIGVVLGKEGALNRMMLPFKFFLGGPVGTGKQWLSWIHLKDLCRIVRFIVEHQELSGPINATAPEPVTMRKFCSLLGEVMNRPSWLPIPEIVLRTVLGQMAEMLLHGQRVIPMKISEAGFEFLFPDLSSALKDVLGKA